MLPNAKIKIKNSFILIKIEWNKDIQVLNEPIHRPKIQAKNDLTN